jgi:hypothetical protein
MLALQIELPSDLALPLISTYHQILALPWISHLPKQIKPNRQILM